VALRCNIKNDADKDNVTLKTLKMNLVFISLPLSVNKQPRMPSCQISDLIYSKGVLVDDDVLQQ